MDKKYYCYDIIMMKSILSEFCNSNICLWNGPKM